MRTKHKIDITSAGYGHFKISTKYYNKIIDTVTTNTQAIDRYRNTESPRKAHADFGMTWLQAYEALYNEILRGNPFSKRVQINFKPN